MSLPALMVLVLIALLIFSGIATLDHHVERRRWYRARTHQADDDEEDEVGL